MMMLLPLGRKIIFCYKWGIAWLVLTALHLLAGILLANALREPLLTLDMPKQGSLGLLVWYFLTWPTDAVRFYPPYPTDLIPWIALQGATCNLVLLIFLGALRRDFVRFRKSVLPLVLLGRLLALGVAVIACGFIIAMNFSWGPHHVTSARAHSLAQKERLLAHFFSIPGPVSALDYRLNYSPGLGPTSVWCRVAVRTSPSQVNAWLQFNHMAFEPMPATCQLLAHPTLHSLTAQKDWAFLNKQVWRARSRPQYYGHSFSSAEVYREEGIVLLNIVY